MNPQIVNIINFIRGVEPRDPSLDLVEPVRGQLELLRRHRLKGTFLLQYDALLREDIITLLLTQRNESLEYGVWLETMQPLVQDAGIPWRGRFAWDWHTDVGFPIAYIPEERERIVDVLMEKFRSVFGFYPRSVGSWFIDAHTLGYLHRKYDIVACCNCKDQWGTDGYTLWGGYYNQAYYPSKRNSFAPAQRAEQQIPVPVFRMLGSDPIYQYDTGMDADFNPSERQDVYTLEPVYPASGGAPHWIDWFLRENFTPQTLSFGYAQAGQENSFGWDAMKDGLAYQFERFAHMQTEGRLMVQTLEESGRWFRQRYPLTPASTLLARTDWKEEQRQSLWYCSRFYRINLFFEQGKLWVRDIYLFDGEYEERYLREKCDSSACTYDNLPVMDGNRYSGEGVRAGIYPVDEDGQPLRGEVPSVELIGEDAMTVRWPVAGGVMEIICRPDTLEIRGVGDIAPWALAFVTAARASMPVEAVQDRELRLRHHGHAYFVRAEQGSFAGTADKLIARPEDGVIRWKLD